MVFYWILSFLQFLSVSHQCSIYFHRFSIYFMKFQRFWWILSDRYWILLILHIFICFSVSLHLFPLGFRLLYEIPTVLMYFVWFPIEFQRFYSFLSVFHKYSICFHWFSIYCMKFQRLSWILSDRYWILTISTAFYLVSCEFLFIPIGFPSILRISNGFNVF